jgi:hypothetical protein
MDSPEKIAGESKGTIAFLDLRKKRLGPLFPIQQKNHVFKKTTVLKTVVSFHAKHIKVFKTVALLKTMVFLVKLQKYYAAKRSLTFIHQTHGERKGCTYV